MSSENSQQEKIKQFLEAKKKKNANASQAKRPDKVIGEMRKANKQYKKGGLFD